MVKVKKDCKVYFGGHSAPLKAGVEYKADAPIVVANPELFEVVAKAKKAEAKKVEAKKVEKKVEVKVEEPKEELLIEEPVAALEVEVKEEETPRRKKGKK